jgi:hypothetical protein
MRLKFALDEINQLQIRDVDEIPGIDETAKSDGTIRVIQISISP